MSVPCRLQLPDAICHINDPGDRRENASRNYNIEQGNQTQLQHHPTDGDHLQNSRYFSSPVWFHVHFSNEQIQHARADEKNGIARNYKNREPGRKTAVAGVELAPVTDAQADDGAKEQTLVGNWIKNDSQRTPLIVTARDISVQAVAQCGDQENRDGSEAFPLCWRAVLNALTIVNRHRDEGRNHQNPDDGDLVGRGHNTRDAKNCKAFDSLAPARSPISGFPSMSLGSRRLRSAKRQCLIGVRGGKRPSQIYAATKSGRDRPRRRPGDSKSFNLFFDFVSERRGAGPVHDPMIERERERNDFYAFIFAFVGN